jgi:predicted amidohydrolase
MKISVAQNRPVIGDIEANLRKHKDLVELAAAEEASIVIFPELSLSGYEPKIASEVATTPDDSRVTILQQLSDRYKIVIGAGIPLKNTSGITITMFIFQPGQQLRMYSKKYLHADEEPIFLSGENFSSFVVNNTTIALAICYEISIPQHAKDAAKDKPAVYIASVAKFRRHMESTLATLSDTAKTHSMNVMMSNCLGLCDGEECIGSSFVINDQGALVDQLDDSREGVLLFDLKTSQTSKKYL